MRFPRMTTRRWMIAVAVTGLTLGVLVEAVSLYRKAQSHRNKSTVFGMLGSTYRAAAMDGRVEIILNPEVPPLRGLAPFAEIVRRERRAIHYFSLAHKYRHAALYPWLPVRPDPPEPE